MSTQVTNDEPVLVLDDKKYLIENLSDDAKYVVGVLQDLNIQLQSTQMRMTQLQASQNALTAQLKELVEESEGDEEDISEVMPDEAE
jgi:predicted transcriptional regulator|tara:strand:- start:256 stop:516 length:261 start_codon:yes stop_codon:yes gene_type:complete